MRSHAKAMMERMQEIGLNHLLLRNPENLLFAAGYWPALGRSLYLISSDGSSRLLVPESELDFVPSGAADDVQTYGDEGLDSLFTPVPAFKRFLASLSGLVGVELSSETVSSIHVGSEVSFACFPTFDLVRQAGAAVWDATPLMEDLRQTKDLEDLKKIELAHEFASFGLKRGREELREGMSEAELASCIEAEIGSRLGHMGSRRVRAFAFVMSGPNGSRAYLPFDISSDRKMGRKDSVLVELDVQVDGYWADLTRTWFMDPPEELLKRLEAVARANSAAAEAASARTRAADVDAVARRIVAEAGYGGEFNHRLGHGVGFRHHEMPALHPASPHILVEGSTFTVEPGVYGPSFGIRVEDGVVAERGRGRKIAEIPLGVP